ncbi:hypothetical protein G2W53_012030 [Senna tora]|uniref:Uncharacterized protein n=1 Tax=Senna tora TaxID=362788 RepID=A0A834TX18_9FABA|nr:hypothetical protein G2W53_012030 [Senna tora]
MLARDAKEWYEDPPECNAFEALSLNSLAFRLILFPSSPSIVILTTLSISFLPIITLSLALIPTPTSSTSIVAFILCSAIAICGPHDATITPLPRVLSAKPSGRYDLGSLSSPPTLKNVEYALASFGARTTHMNRCSLSSRPNANSRVCSQLNVPPLPSDTYKTDSGGCLSSQPTHSPALSRMECERFQILPSVENNAGSHGDAGEVVEVNELSVYLTVELWKKQGEGKQVGGGGEEGEGRNGEFVADVESLGAEEIDDESLGFGGQVFENCGEGDQALADIDRETCHDGSVVGYESREINGWEIDDVEVGREFGGVKKLVLGGGSFGGDVQEAHVSVMVGNKALRQLK